MPGCICPLGLTSTSTSTWSGTAHAKATCLKTLLGLILHGLLLLGLSIGQMRWQVYVGASCTLAATCRCVLSHVRSSQQWAALRVLVTPVLQGCLAQVWGALGCREGAQAHAHSLNACWAAAGKLVWSVLTCCCVQPVVACFFHILAALSGSHLQLS
jgi:hypothetical protein